MHIKKPTFTKQNVIYLFLVLAVEATSLFYWYGLAYKPIPKEMQLVSEPRLLATKVMQAAKYCDMTSIRKFAQHQIYTTVVQIKNFTGHCMPGALEYRFVSEETKTFTPPRQTGRKVTYTTVFENYDVPLSSQEHKMTVVAQKQTGQSFQLQALTDPYYQYIKDANIFAEGSLP